MVTVEHIYQEGNQAADYLAGFGHSQCSKRPY
ncbi:unnamed protein product [Cuscuta epithymum]|uniref:RNase H type-1 domain-containing protein n=1 Tax=Cuscuta epithymum TaxID=186058 RepID=A0AAV0E1F0_9ASTE|nr:unnamed protein product [Cuscuta epithymum]